MTEKRELKLLTALFKEYEKKVDENVLTHLLIAQLPERKNIEIFTEFLTGINKVCYPGVGHMSILNSGGSKVLSSNLVDMKNKREVLAVITEMLDVCGIMAEQTMQQLEIE